MFSFFIFNINTCDKWTEFRFNKSWLDVQLWMEIHTCNTFIMSPANSTFPKAFLSFLSIFRIARVGRFCCHLSVSRSRRISCLFACPALFIVITITYVHMQKFVDIIFANMSFEFSLISSGFLHVVRESVHRPANGVVTGSPSHSTQTTYESKWEKKFHYYRFSHFIIF